MLCWLKSGSRAYFVTLYSCALHVNTRDLWAMIHRFAFAEFSSLNIGYVLRLTTRRLRCLTQTAATQGTLSIFFNFIGDLLPSVSVLIVPLEEYPS